MTVASLRNRAVAAGVLLAATLGTGCYGFVEVPPSAIAAGNSVRVTLSAQEVARQEATLPGLRRRIEGDVVQARDSGTLDLTVHRLDGTPAQRPDLNAFVTLPWSAVLRVEEKRFHRTRTLALVAGGAVAAAALLAAATGGTTDGDGGPNPDAIIEISLPAIFGRR